MNIFFTITDSYVPFCGVTITSIVDNNPDMPLDFYICCPDLSPSNKDKLELMCSKWGGGRNPVLKSY